MSTLYHPDATDPSVPIGSFWEADAPAAEHPTPALDGEHDVDVAVIGGGYTGLSAALTLARDQRAKVGVLDAGAPGWGASGRNGGFCAMGGIKISYETMIRRYGMVDTVAFHEAQVQSIQTVRDIAAREAIDFDAIGAGEYAIAHKPNRFREMLQERDFLKRTFGMDCPVLGPDEMAGAGLSGAGFHGALLYPVGFGLHPMKYARGLSDACVRRGVAVHGQSPVVAWRREKGAHVLVTPKGALRARSVIIATNGYTPEGLLPGLAGRTLPVPSNIIVTRPLSPDEQAAQGFTSHTPAFDSRILLHYFRLLPDGRFLIGARGGLDGSRNATAEMRAKLESDFRAMFPAWSGVEITHFWRGFICMTRDRVPHVGVLDDGPAGPVYYGFGYHGSGVAMGTWTGAALGRLAGNGGDFKAAGIPRVMTQPLGAFPLPALRLYYLRLALLGYRVKDALL